MRDRCSVASARCRVRTSLAALLVAGLSLTLCLVPPCSPRTGEARSAPPAGADPAEDEQEGAFRDAGARAVLRDNCLICHSEELVTGQKLTRAQWQAEVDKMVGWGTPLAPDQVAPLVDYLTERYSESTPTRPPVRTSYEGALSRIGPEAVTDRGVPGDAERGAALYQAHCATCHGKDGQGGDLGPNLVETAVLLRPAEYSAVVRDGRHRMPGFKLVMRPAQEDEVLSWLRRQTYRSPPTR